MDQPQTNIRSTSGVCMTRPYTIINQYTTRKAGIMLDQHRAHQTIKILIILDNHFHQCKIILNLYFARQCYLKNCMQSIEHKTHRYPSYCPARRSILILTALKYLNITIETKALLQFEMIINGLVFYFHFI